MCEPGTPVKCGDVIRLEHVDTAKNLHSHLFRSPVSGGQEVSGFGERGEGDTGDSWKVICESNNDDYWRRYKPVALQHLDTGKFLSTADVYKFTQSNCGMQCPIMGQTEVAAASRKDSKAKWQTDQGVYFPVNIAGENDSDEL